MIKKCILKSLVTCMIITLFMFSFYRKNSFADSLGTVTVSKLNVRSGPSTKNKVIGSLRMNNSVQILSTSNGWYQVKFSSNKTGWASSKYISIGNSNNSNANNTQINTSGSIKHKMNVVATAYTGYSTTSTGQKPVWGTIAVDPKVIPYGTKVYIPKFNKVFIANNTGGAIKGNKIDIFMNTKKECYSWGRKNIEIHILN